MKVLSGLRCLAGPSKPLDLRGNRGPIREAQLGCRIWELGWACTHSAGKQDKQRIAAAFEELPGVNEHLHKEPSQQSQEPAAASALSRQGIFCQGPLIKAQPSQEQYQIPSA